MAIIHVLGVPHTYELTAPTENPCVLVFIHGWLLSRGYWQPLIERLSPFYQCLSYDLRGFGDSNWQLGKQLQHSTSEATADLETVGSSVATKPFRATSQVDTAIQDQPDSISPTAVSTIQGHSSPLPQSRYSPAAYAHDLTVLLQTLNIQQAWLVGHSLGGSIALWGADQMLHQVKGVICLNSGGGIYLKEEFERFRAAGQQLLKLRPRWLCHFPLLDLLFARASVVQTIDRAWGRQRVIDFVMAHPEAALGTLMDSTTEEEVHYLPQVVSRLQQPVYFLAGAQDPIMEPKYVRHLASFHALFRCCGDNVFEIPNCGHMAMLEQPDWVATQMQVILSKHEKGWKGSEELTMQNWDAS
ncbi:MAG: alpha/beta hydrolase [Scytolyngbya sp. HA4215-MV1]|jgi:pimeloyl-ACP methyl ester carboxylesterase|nr:alpha/beta hydrolase [Scytolyngbya sp. HA4215-MV1]